MLDGTCFQTIRHGDWGNWLTDDSDNTDKSEHAAHCYPIVFSVSELNCFISCHLTETWLKWLLHNSSSFTYQVSSVSWRDFCPWWRVASRSPRRRVIFENVISPQLIYKSFYLFIGQIRHNWAPLRSTKEQRASNKSRTSPILVVCLDYSKFQL